MRRVCVTMRRVCVTIRESFPTFPIDRISKEATNSLSSLAGNDDDDDDAARRVVKGRGDDARPRVRLRHTSVCAVSPSTRPREALEKREERE